MCLSRFAAELAGAKPFLADTPAAAADLHRDCRDRSSPSTAFAQRRLSGLILHAVVTMIVPIRYAVAFDVSGFLLCALARTTQPVVRRVVVIGRPREIISVAELLREARVFVLRAVGASAPPYLSVAFCSPHADSFDTPP